MKNLESNFKAIKEVIAESLEGSIYFDNGNGSYDETNVDTFRDDWADEDSAGIVFEIDGVSYTITIRANK